MLPTCIHCFQIEPSAGRSCLKSPDGWHTFLSPSAQEQLAKASAQPQAPEVPAPAVHDTQSVLNCTPGNWTTHRNPKSGAVVISTKQGNRKIDIALVLSGSPSEVEANASVMAQSKELYRVLEAIFQRRGVTGQLFFEDSELWEDATIVLAKARGEKPDVSR